MNKDRAYTIQIGGIFKEISISAKAVDGLIVLNQPGRRENGKKDKSFLKALLISVCSLKTIQCLRTNQKPAKEMISFIKGTYRSFCDIYALRFKNIFNFKIPYFIH